MELENSEMPPNYRASRPMKRACVICHSRKVKCDGAVNGFPCSNCRAAQLECTLAARRKRTRLSGTARDRRLTGSRRLARDADASHVGASLSAYAEAPGSCVQDPANAANSAAKSSAGGDDSEDDDAEHDDAENQHNSGEKDTEYTNESAVAAKHLVHFFSQDLQRSQIKTRLIYVGNELSNLNHLTRQRSANSRVYHYPCSNPAVPRVLRGPHHAATPIPSQIPQDAFILPPKQVSDVLVEAYFENVHPGMPIIDKESFLSQYHGNSPSSPSLLLLQAICLVGAHVSTTIRNSQSLKVAFFRRAKALFDARYEEDRMEMVQAALLLTWHSDGGDDVCANAWWWTGIAARTAVALGMHRDVGPSSMPEVDKRTWKMIWWTVVQFDCVVSLAYGRPQNINLDDCDTEALTAEVFADQREKAAVNFAVHHSSLCEVISELVRSQFSVKARKSSSSHTERLRVVDTALADWLIKLPSNRQDKRAQMEENASPWSLLLHLTYNAALIQFHRPQSTTAVAADNADRMANEEICAGAASTIIRIVDQLNQHSWLKRCLFWVPSFMFTAMLQVRMQAKSHNPILALRAKETYDCGLRLLQKLSRYWLFASSVWALFRSNSITPRTNREEAEDEERLDTGSNLPEWGVSTVSSTESATHNHGAIEIERCNSIVVENDAPPQMSWTQMLGNNELNNNSLQIERNRWQDSIDEWRSLYWSDPLTDMRMQENLGDMQFDWLG